MIRIYEDILEFLDELCTPVTDYNLEPFRAYRHEALLKRGSIGHTSDNPRVVEWAIKENKICKAASRAKAKKVLRAGVELNALKKAMSSQAIDMLQGFVKLPSLPEVFSNCRVTTLDADASLGSCRRIERAHC